MMVTHIKNALIFYHEPYASSASEMVAELARLLGGAEITEAVYDNAREMKRLAGERKKSG